MVHSLALISTLLRLEAVSFSNGASISSAGLLQSPDIQSTATVKLEPTLTVGGTSVLTGDLTANGSVNTITNGQLPDSRWIRNHSFIHTAE